MNEAQADAKETKGRCLDFRDGVLCAPTGYGAWIDDAETRHRRGERQLYCGQHGCRWVWPDECNHKGRLTSKEFAAMVRAIKKQVVRHYPSAEKRYLRELRKATQRGEL